MPKFVETDDLGPEFLMGPVSDPTHVRIDDSAVINRTVSGSVIDGTSLEVDVSGVSGTIDLSTVSGTLTSLTDNGDGTATYVDEDAVSSDFDPWIGTRGVATETTVEKSVGAPPFGPILSGLYTLVTKTGVATRFATLAALRDTVTDRLYARFGFVNTATSNTSMIEAGDDPATGSKVDVTVTRDIAGLTKTVTGSYQATDTDTRVGWLTTDGINGTCYGGLSVIPNQPSVSWHAFNADFSKEVQITGQSGPDGPKGFIVANDGTTHAVVGTILPTDSGLGGTVGSYEARLLVGDPSKTVGIGADLADGVKVVPNGRFASGAGRALVSQADGVHVDWSTDPVVTSVALTVNTATLGSETLDLSVNGIVVQQLPLVASGGGWALA